MKPKYSLTTILFLLLITSVLRSQSVAINTNGSAPSSSSVLDVQSTNKGMLLPRMTTAQRNAIANPALGLLVFDTNEKTLYMYDGSRWTGFVPAHDNSRPANNLLFAPVNDDSLAFGNAVSIWEDVAAIGVPRYNPASKNLSGGVFIYKKTAGAWTQQQIIVPPAAAANSEFGWALNLCGNYLIVGAPKYTNAASQTIGAAYIYAYNNNSWQLQHTITGTEADANFAAMVDINQFGNYALVSESYATVNNKIGAGRAHVYNKMASWSLQTTLQLVAPQQDDNFGVSVAMSNSGDYIVVGAPGRSSSANYERNGFAGLYRRSGASWALFKTFVPPAKSSTRLGTQVDVTDLHVLAMTGADYHTELFINQMPLAPEFGWSPELVNTNGLTLSSVAFDRALSFIVFRSGNQVYNYDGRLIKSIAIDTKTDQTSQTAFSAYNNSFVVGFPFESKKQNSYEGAVIFFE